MTFPQALFLFAAALIAGAMNSVAGGGSFFSFPALLFTGVAPIPANATSTVAVWPGSLASVGAYRKRLPKSARVAAPLFIASLAGGLVGAGLLLHTPQRTFMRLVPFLFIAATLLFAFGPRFSRTSSAPQQQSAQPTALAVGGAAFFQLLIGIYGGYFGGGMGILMLALLSLLPLGDIHAQNSLKALLAAGANGMAIVAFIAARIILWPQAAVMLAGAVLGGYSGAHYAQKLNPARVRAFVVAVGLVMSLYFLWKYR